jgi:hypothetical protein
MTIRKSSLVCKSEKPMKCQQPLNPFQQCPENLIKQCRMTNLSGSPSQKISVSGATIQYSAGSVSTTLNSTLLIPPRTRNRSPLRTGLLDFQGVMGVHRIPRNSGYNSSRLTLSPDELIPRSSISRGFRLLSKLKRDPFEATVIKKRELFPGLPLLSRGSVLLPKVLVRSRFRG